MIDGLMIGFVVGWMIGMATAAMIVWKMKEQ